MSDEEVELDDNELGVWNFPLSPDGMEIDTEIEDDGYDEDGWKQVGADLWFKPADDWDNYIVYHVPHLEDEVEVDFYKPYKPYMWNIGYIEDDKCWTRVNGKYKEDKPE